MWPFGVSNIAWPAEVLDEVLPLLPWLGFAAVEVAPFNMFGGWTGILDDARRLRERFAEHGLICSALQGILFKVPEATLFGDAAARTALRRHLEFVAELADVLGARACVFGSPRQRDPGDLAPAESWAQAVDFFRSVGPVFAARGTSLAIEANARHYGCRFLVTTEATAAFVAEVDCPGIGLQIDTGTVLLEQEDPAVLRATARTAVHAHVSAPDLAPVGEKPFRHGALGAELRASGYRGSLSIEMRATADWRNALIRAAEFVHRVYL